MSRFPSNVFGQNTSTSQNVFGASSKSLSGQNIFGAALENPVFGSAPVSSTTAGFMSSTSTFAQSSSGSVNPFGTKSPTSKVFGASTTTTSASIFGISTPSFGSASTSGVPSLFGTTTPSAPVFGGVSSLTTSVFGAGNSSKPVYGSSSAFGTTTSAVSSPFAVSQSSTKVRFGEGNQSFSGASSASAFVSGQVSDEFSKTSLPGGQSLLFATKPSSSSPQQPIYSTQTTVSVEMTPLQTTTTTTTAQPIPSLFGVPMSTSSSVFGRKSSVFAPSKNSSSTNVFGVMAKTHGEESGNPFKPISTVPSLMEQPAFVVTAGSSFSTRAAAATSASPVDLPARPTEPTPEEEIERDTSPVRGRGGGASVRRRSSGTFEESIALIVKGLQPTDTKVSLKRHFDKFGVVKDVRLNTRLFQATITFENHEQAARAKQLGRTMNPNTTRARNLVIFFKKPQPPRQKSALEADVNSELIAMGGGDYREPLPLPAGLRTAEIRKPSPEPYRESTPPIVPSRLRAQMLGGIPVYAKTNAEKWEVLKERDKIIRARHTKNTDIKSAKVVEGTCLDMCPETERYMRQEQRRLSCYEWIEGTERNLEGPRVNHSLAIKEYSRSAADQDEPLSHDLRPIPTLKLTMNYLMSRIMDTGGEGQWEMYYEFIWNRTRAIRKDITLQHFRGLEAVDLVEKCARWHAYCSERLCEEDHNVFDPKVNTENLTKCLESLKQFYDDLAVKNVVCPNEAEFRSYVVLLNLKEGDTLRIVQNLRPEVRSSSAIKLAVDMYAALNQNNYVRFFRLMKLKATFLQACICHRYFFEIRSEGLKRMCHVYTHGKTLSTSFPLQRLVKVLGFEGEVDASSFCRLHGLKVEGDVISLERRSMVEPEGHTASRAKDLIEAKMEGFSVGEIVNGNLPLSPVVLLEPSSCFDDNGLFVQQLKEADMSPETTNVPAAIATQDIGSFEMENDIIKETVMESIVDDIVLQVSQEMSRDIFHDMCMMDGMINRVVDETVFETVDEMIGQLVKEQILELEEIEERETRERLLQEMRRAEEAKRKEAALRDELEKRAVSSIAGEIMDSVYGAMIRQIAEEEMAEVEEALHQSFLDSLCLLIHDNTVSSIVDEMTTSVARECHREFVSDILHSLSGIKVRHEKRIAGLFFSRWRAEHLKRRKRREALEMIPRRPSVEGGILEKNMPKLMSVPDLTKVGERLSDQIAIEIYSKQRIREETMKPFDLTEFFGKQLMQLQGKRRAFLKLAIILSEGHDQNKNADCRWLLTKFRRAQVAPEIQRKYDLKGSIETLAFYSCRSENYIETPFTICVKTVLEEIPHQSFACAQRLLSGTQGLIFPFFDGSHLRNSARLLKNILGAKVATPSVPLVILLFPSESISYDEADLTKLSMILNELVATNYLTAFEIIAMSKDSVEKIDNNDALKKGLNWMSARLPSPPLIERRPLQDVVDSSIVKGVLEPFIQDSTSLLSAEGLHPGPNDLINVHNAVVDALSREIEISENSAFCWPIVEAERHPEMIPFDWNSSFRTIDLTNAVTKLKLPKFSPNGNVKMSNSADDYGEFEIGLCEEDHKFDYDSLDWDSSKRLVWRFVTSLLEAEDRVHSMGLFTRIQWLMNKTERGFRRRLEERFLPLREAKNNLGTPLWENLPWIDIVIAAINYKLATNSWVRNGSGEELEMFLTGAAKDRLEAAVNEPKYKSIPKIQNHSLSRTFDETLEKSTKRKRIELLKTEASKPAKIMDLRLDKNSPSIRPFDASLSSLAKRVSLEKTESTDFENWLVSVVDEPLGPKESKEALAGPKIESPLDELNSNSARSIELKMDSLKRKVETVKFKDKLYELDLFNIIASDELP